MKKFFSVLWLCISLTVVMASPPITLGNTTAAEDESTVTGCNVNTDVTKDLTTMLHQTLVASVVSIITGEVIFAEKDSLLSGSTAECLAAMRLAPVVNKEDYTIKRAYFVALNELAGEMQMLQKSENEAAETTTLSRACSKSYQTQEYVEGLVVRSGGINLPPTTTTLNSLPNLNQLVTNNRIFSGDTKYVLKHPSLLAVNTSNQV